MNRLTLRSSRYHDLVLIAAALAVVCLSACGRDTPGAGAAETQGSAEHSTSRRLPQRTILVFDPTAFADRDSAELVQGAFRNLQQFVTNPAIRSVVDVYIVGRGRINAGPDFQDSIAFDAKVLNRKVYEHRADSLARAVVALALAEWRKSRVAAAVPNSCILTTVGRTQNSLEGARAGKEAVALVIVSDLLEFCDEAGTLNFERTIPERIDSPPRVDLSPLSSVYVVQVHNRRLPNLAAQERLETLWRGTLGSYLGDSTRVEIKGEVYPKDRQPLFDARRDRR